jgi:TetR/AcrR family transcriptional repressor of mexJK operon
MSTTNTDIETRHAVVRTTRRGMERGVQILASATTLFLAHGFSGVSVDDIVKAGGGSKTNVYRQFGSKEGLFVAVVQAMCEDFLQQFNGVELAGMDAKRGLTTLARTLLKTLLEDRHIAFQRLVIAESSRFPALGRAWFASGPQTSRQVIADFIQTQQRAGLLRKMDPMTAATLFHDMLVFNPTHLATVGVTVSEKQINRHVAGVVDIFLRGSLCV